MDEKLNGRAAATDDQRPYIRGELQSLSQMISRALPRTTDRTTRLHLEDSRNEIARALDPKFQPAAPATGTNPFGRVGVGEFEFNNQSPLLCWPDYAIRRSGK